MSGGTGNVVFGRIGDAGGKVGDGLTGARRIPFFLAVFDKAEGGERGVMNVRVRETGRAPLSSKGLSDAVAAMPATSFRSLTPSS